MAQLQPLPTGAIDSLIQGVWVAIANFDEKVGFAEFDFQIVDDRADLFWVTPTKVVA